jgi:hypothetical protein
MPGKGRDFSTFYWKEQGRRYPFGAVVAGYLAVYLTFLVALRPYSSYGVSIPLTLLLVGCIGFFHVCPAIRAVRLFASRRALKALMESMPDVPEAARDFAAAKWLNSGIKDVAMTYLMHMLLLAPVSLVGAGLGGLLGLPGGLFLVPLSASALLFSTMLGTYLGLRLRPGLAGRWAGCAAAGVFGLKTAVLVFAAELAGRRFGSVEVFYLAVILLDALLLLAAGAWLLMLLPKAFEHRKRSSHREYATEYEIVIDAPDDLGLDIGFSALGRWIFIEDPFYKTERRLFWTAWRQVVLWVVIASGVIMGSRLIESGIFQTGLAAFDLFICSILCRPALWIAPAVTAMGIAHDRRSGLLEDLSLTPVAPLRIVASKLAGRCGKLVFASLAVLVLGAWVCIGGLQFLKQGAEHLTLLHFMAAAQTFVLTPVAILTYGAMGLYFATRFKSIGVALLCSYILLAVLEFSVIVFSADLFRFFRWAYISGIPLLRYLVLSAVVLLAMGLLMRFFLLGAARQLVLRRGE